MDESKKQKEARAAGWAATASMNKGLEGFPWLDFDLSDFDLWSFFSFVSSVRLHISKKEEAE